MGTYKHGKSLTDALDKEIARCIRARRQQLGLSQGYLGREIGCSAQQVHKYEREMDRISAGRLYEICYVLDINLDDLYYAVWFRLSCKAGYEILETDY